MWNIHNITLPSNDKKKKNLLIHETTWMSSKNMLSEQAQHKMEYTAYLHFQKILIQTNESTITESRTVIICELEARRTHIIVWQKSTTR